MLDEPLLELRDFLLDFDALAPLLELRDLVLVDFDLDLDALGFDDFVALDLDDFDAFGFEDDFALLLFGADRFFGWAFV